MSQPLQELSHAMATLVEQANPAVVRVEGRRRLAATGIIYDSDGLVVTANHVVERDDNLVIGTADGASHPATIAGRDPDRDIALLRVEASGLNAARWTAPSDLRVGHLVLALGRPGQTVQATLGVISALGEGWRTRTGAEMGHYIQTDVAMYPGFSGGPLLTTDGTFAGINSSSLLRGISVTIPGTTISSTVDTLLTHGSVPRGYLGVGIQPVRLAASLQESLGQETGLMIMSIEADSPAASGGLLQGDILVKIGETPLRHVDELQAQLGADSVGKTTPIQVVRSGSTQELTVSIGQSG